MYLIEHILFGLVFGVHAFNFCALLTDPGNIFDWWPRFVSRLLYGQPYAAVGTDWKGKISRVLWACPKCHAGQWAFWSYLLTHRHHYDFMAHLTVFAVAVFVAHHLTVRYSGT